MANIQVFPLRVQVGDHVEELNQRVRSFLTDLENNSDNNYHLVNSISDFDDGDLGVFFVESGKVEPLFRDITEIVRGPYYLLTMDYGDSLSAALEIVSYLHGVGKEGIIIHGTGSEINEQINKHIEEKIYTLSKEGFRLGIIGRPSDWLIGSEVDYFRARMVFNVDLTDLTMQELIFDYAGISAHLEQGRLEAVYDEKELNKAYRVYKALKVMIRDHHLDGIALCGEDLFNSLRATPSLAVSLLGERGIVALEETDVTSLLCALNLKYALHAPSFEGHPFFIDARNNNIAFDSNSVPLNMTESYSFGPDYHFEEGIAVKGILKKEPVTVVMLSNGLRHFYAEEGEIVANLAGKAHRKTQILVHLSSASVENLLVHPLGGRALIVYGHHQAEIEKYYLSRGLKRSGTD